MTRSKTSFLEQEVGQRPFTDTAESRPSEQIQDGGIKRQIMSTLWLIGLSITAGVAGQTLLKLGVSHPGAASFASFDPVAVILMIFKSPLMIGGLILYGVGALSWIMVLSRLNLSYAYPFLALNFVLIALVSRLVLGEPIPLMRWMGIVLISIGIIVIAQSSSGQG
jgi:drug/metabolite transporter (DMT)-like permease